MTDDVDTSDVVADVVPLAAPFRAPKRRALAYIEKVGTSSLKPGASKWLVRKKYKTPTGDIRALTKTVHGSRADAERLAAQLVTQAQQLASGVLKLGSTTTLRNYAFQTMAKFDPDWTLVKKSILLTHCRPLLDLPLSSIDQATVQRWVWHLELKKSKATGHPLAAATVEAIYQCLHNVMWSAWRDGLLAAQPWVRVKVKRPGKKPKWVPRPDDIARLLDAVQRYQDDEEGAGRPRDTDLRLRFEVLLALGLRKSEGAALERQHVQEWDRDWTVLVAQAVKRDKKKRGAFVLGTTKSTKYRKLPIAESLARRLLARWDELPEAAKAIRCPSGCDACPHSPIFPTSHSGGRLGGVGWRFRRGGLVTKDQFRTLVRLAGFPDDFTPHRLRHTTATYVKKRHGLGATQLLLGHADARTTAGYVHEDGDDIPRGAATATLPLLAATTRPALPAPVEAPDDEPEPEPPTSSTPRRRTRGPGKPFRGKAKPFGHYPRERTPRGLLERAADLALAGDIQGARLLHQLAKELREDPNAATVAGDCSPYRWKPYEDAPAAPAPETSAPLDDFAALDEKPAWPAPRPTPLGQGGPELLNGCTRSEGVPGEVLSAVLAGPKKASGTAGRTVSAVSPQPVALGSGFGLHTALWSNHASNPQGTTEDAEMTPENGSESKP